MIRRLTAMSLQDFRLFRGEHRIALDGDVVLIYGANGSGKSSLLSAIEFGLTGSVSDLLRYGKDFPRCLRNVHAEGSAEVRVTFESTDATIISTTSVVSDSDNLERSSQNLDEASRQFFSERCYLSQVRLGRLLDMYQAVEKGSADPPIVQFVKRLLRLDSLESLSEALHDIEDVRRTRKKYTEVSYLEDRERKLASEKSELALEINASATSRTSVANAIQTVIGSLDGSVKISELNLVEVSKLAERFSAWISELTNVEVQSIEKDAQKIREVKIVIENSKGAVDDRLLGLEQELRNQEVILNELLVRLQPILDDAVAELQAISGVTDLFPDSASFEDQWSQTELRLSQTLIRLEADHKAMQIDEDRLLNLRAMEAEKRKELTALQDELSELASAVPQWAETLASLANQITADECPVCLRDFSELGKGSLGDFVQQRANQIGLNAKRLQECELNRAKLLLQIADVDRNIVALSVRFGERVSANRLVATFSSLKGVAQRLEANRSSMEECIRVANALVPIRLEIRLSQARIVQLGEAKAALAIIAQRLDVKAPTGVSLSELLSFLEQKFVEVTHKQSQTIKVIREVVMQLSTLTLLLKEADRLDRHWLELNEQELKIAEARRKVDQITGKARRVLKCAIAAKRKLLDRVFDETLNHLWTELFERLARNEPFKPRLSESKATRDQIRTTMQAVAEGIDPFENVGAVHSFGNQNTSALSLFLALNLIGPPRHHVLILDDPVQSMDDVHISQFAVLLKELINQAGRQIFVAVHERPLFDYLAFELTPNLSGRKLVTIELDRLSDSLNCNLKVETRVWIPDNVSLELAARAS